MLPPLGCFSSGQPCLGLSSIPPELEFSSLGQDSKRTISNYKTMISNGNCCEINKNKRSK